MGGIFQVLRLLQPTGPLIAVSDGPPQSVAVVAAQPLAVVGGRVQIVARAVVQNAERARRVARALAEPALRRLRVVRSIGP